MARTPASPSTGMGQPISRASMGCWAFRSRPAGPGKLIHDVSDTSEDAPDVLAAEKPILGVSNGQPQHLAF
ncbi:uncharacterized protein PG998_011701 [Apiospora kogelbergensis]|uniref:uncharacterized protein n=1 Tax=Apiospora kogelbergensis TaxID=1337665 RepID=UPI0031309F24